MSTALNYLTLSNYGDFIELDMFLKDPVGIARWTEENFSYVRYNKNKPIDRWGLSITSHNGGVSGEKDLDSFYHPTGKAPDEMDFTVKTPVCDHPEIKKLCDYWGEHLGRSHLLKLNSGAFFPPHRDHRSANLETFRIIVPLQNFDYPDFTFCLEEKILRWKGGRAYYLNTSKVHHLFNCSGLPSYWIVLNIATNEDSVMRTINLAKYK